MNTQMKIEMRDPAVFQSGSQVKFHPALKLIPELPEDGDEFLALAAMVKKCGVIRPLLVDEEGNIVDDHSRSLWRVARRWQMTTVPVKVIQQDDVELTIIHSLAHVRHLTKAAIAWLASDLITQAAEAGLRKRVQNVHKSPMNADSALSAPSKEPASREEVAELLRISLRTLTQVREIKALFKKYPGKYSFTLAGGATDGGEAEMTLEEYFVPRIIKSPIGGEHEDSRPIGLGNVITGIHTKIEQGKNGDKFSSKKHDQLWLFTKKTDVVEAWSYYKKMSDDQRAQHFKLYSEKLENLDPDDCDAMAEYFGKLEKICRRKANAN